MRRKGELSKSAIDRDWPHQVALPADQVSGRPFVDIQQFCSELSLAPRGHYFRRNDRDYVVFCFAKRVNAELFQGHYGGEWFDRKADAARRRIAARAARTR